MPPVFFWASPNGTPAGPISARESHPISNARNSIGILRALVIAAGGARLEMDSEGGFLGDERLGVVAIAIIDARVGFSD